MSKVLMAFDLDETLIHVGHKPLARNKFTNRTRELDSSLTEPLGEDEVYDFSLFECIDTFRESIPINSWSMVFNTTPIHHDIAIITARTSFVDTPTFRNIMVEKGFDLVNVMRAYIFFVGDRVEQEIYPSTPVAKAETIKKLIKINSYNKVIFMDDSRNNIEEVNNITNDYEFRDIEIITCLT